jgi:hypothetical protein
MKFTLTYDGSLPASANRPKNQAKWDIRQQLHPQLVDLWASHPALRFVDENRYFPKTGGGFLIQAHHDHPGPITPPPGLQSQGKGVLDLCEPVEKHGAWFRPLVRSSYALHCGLKITFLRQEPPGKLYQAGDLDGRMKTLLDALAMPQHCEQVLGSAAPSSPIYCLMEDDALVSGLQIESERLLTDKTNPPDWVRLNIEVDIRVKQATIYNQSFLG